jgi:hypothetical protein
MIVVVVQPRFADPLSEFEQRRRIASASRFVPVRIAKEGFLDVPPSWIASF